MAKPFVLVVDDDRNIAAVLAHLLRSAGFRVETAPGALEGVGLARKDRPDLILMDMMMPGLEGATAAQMIQSTEGLGGIPIVLISAMPEEDARRRMADSGAVDFIAKPFYRESLLSVIRKRLPAETGGSAKPRDDTRVLVVDDDPKVTKLVAGALRQVGLGTWETQDAKEALRLAKELRPGLIITDVHMPGVGGIELCMQLKSDPATSHIPVIFMSGDSTAESHEQGKFTGGAAYFDKPLDLPAFLKTIQGLLRPASGAGPR